MISHLNRPMPRHAARYFEDQFHATCRAARRQSRLVRAILLVPAVVLLFGCFLADEIERLTFHRVDRFLLRLSQIAITFAVVVLVAGVLQAILSGAFDRAVR